MFETNCHLDRIVDRSNIVKKFIYLFLSIVGVIFIVLIQCSFAKLQLNVIKNFEIIFAACATVSISSKSVAQVLKVKFFFLRGVISAIHFQIKSSFSSEWNTHVERRDRLWQRSLMRQGVIRKLYSGRTWNHAKFLYRKTTQLLMTGIFEV